MANLFLGLTVIGCVLLVAFPLAMRFEYLRRRDRFPKVYWIARMIGLECGAIAIILVGLMGLSVLSVKYMREAQLNLWVISIIALQVTSSIGWGIWLYIGIRHAIRQIKATSLS